MLIRIHPRSCGSTGRPAREIIPMVVDWQRPCTEERDKDIEFIVERIDVYDDHIDIQLRSDIDALLHISQSEEIERAACGETALVRKVRNHRADERSIHSVSSGDWLVVHTVSRMYMNTMGLYDVLIFRKTGCRLSFSEN